MASFAPIKTYERVCSDLTVLASLDSTPGQERKLIYSLAKGLDTEPNGYNRSVVSYFNWAASYIRLDSGYTREISDLTPIIGNIRDYCSSGLGSLGKEKVQTLASKIRLGVKGLTEHMKKYANQPEKEQILSRAIDELQISFLSVLTCEESFKIREAAEQDVKHPSILRAAEVVAQAMKGLFHDLAEGCKTPV